MDVVVYHKADLGQPNASRPRAMPASYVLSQLKQQELCGWPETGDLSPWSDGGVGKGKGAGRPCISPLCGKSACVGPLCGGGGLRVADELARRQQKLEGHRGGSGGSDSLVSLALSRGRWGRQLAQPTDADAGSSWALGRRLGQLLCGTVGLCLGDPKPAVGELVTTALPGGGTITEEYNHKTFIQVRETGSGFERGPWSHSASAQR